MSVFCLDVKEYFLWPIILSLFYAFVTVHLISFFIFLWPFIWSLFSSICDRPFDHFSHPFVTVHLISFLIFLWPFIRSNFLSFSDRSLYLLSYPFLTVHLITFLIPLWPFICSLFSSFCDRSVDHFSHPLVTVHLITFLILLWLFILSLFYPFWPFIRSPFLSFCDRSLDLLSYPFVTVHLITFLILLLQLLSMQKAEAKVEQKAELLTIYIHQLSPTACRQLQSQQLSLSTTQNGERSDRTDNVIGKTATGRNVNILYFCRMLDSSYACASCSLFSADYGRSIRKFARGFSTFSSNLLHSFFPAYSILK